METHLMEEGFRWFGPGDPVPLSFIRQAGASSVFTSLHQIPYGEAWSREAIRERKAAAKAVADRAPEAPARYDAALAEFLRIADAASATEAASATRATPSAPWP